MYFLANSVDRLCWYCVHWERETGVDDDGRAPAPLFRPKSPEALAAQIDLAAVVIARRLDRASAGLKVHRSLLGQRKPIVAWLHELQHHQQVDFAEVSLVALLTRERHVGDRSGHTASTGWPPG